MIYIVRIYVPCMYTELHKYSMYIHAYYCGYTYLDDTGYELRQY